LPSFFPIPLLQHLGDPIMERFGVCHGKVWWRQLMSKQKTHAQAKDP
jgi:hypothetical protein